MSNVQKILNLYKEGKIPESTIIKMAAFKHELEEMLKTDMEKKGGILSDINISKPIIWGALAGPAAALSDYFFGKGIHALEHFGEAEQRDKAFKAMLEIRPQLRNEDPIIVRKYFDSLANFAPAIASDPLAAAAYITQVIKFEETGGPPFQAVEALVKTQKAFKDSQPMRATGLGERFLERPRSSMPPWKDIK